MENAGGGVAGVGAALGETPVVGEFRFNELITGLRANVVQLRISGASRRSSPGHPDAIPENWKSNMSTSEILSELPKLSRVERRAILNRLIELDEDAEVLDERRRQADEAFQMLDAMEAEDAESEAR